jgi:hypothetical protein
VATGSWNYSIEELSKLLTERLHGPWHLLFVNSAWWLWHRNYKQAMSATTVASSPNWKDRAAARSARFVARDTGSIYYLASVAICWPAKTVDATDYRPFGPSLCRHRNTYHYIDYLIGFCFWGKVIGLTRYVSASSRCTNVCSIETFGYTNLGRGTWAGAYFEKISNLVTIFNNT